MQHCATALLLHLLIVIHEKMTKCHDVTDRRIRHSRVCIEYQWKNNVNFVNIFFN